MCAKHQCYGAFTFLLQRQSYAFGHATGLCIASRRQRRRCAPGAIVGQVLFYPRKNHGQRRAFDQTGKKATVLQRDKVLLAADERPRPRA